MKKKSLILFCIFISSFSFSQNRNSDYRKKFTEGNYLVLEGNYVLALQNYLEAYAIDSSNANINYKIGYCYLKTEDDKGKALPYLKKAIANVSKTYDDVKPSQKSAPVHAYYYFGQALHYDYKFDEAIASYEKFKSFLRPKLESLLKDVDRQMEISNNGKALVAAPTNLVLKNLGNTVNSGYPDYSSILSPDEKTIMFTSRRTESSGGEKTDDGQFFEDIYIAYKKTDSTWTSPVSVGQNINTTSNEANLGLTADAQTILLYKDVNGGDIYLSKLDGTPQAMGSDINSPQWETSAFLTTDGNTLYFVSNRPGGLGGRDIWKSIKLPNGQWGSAQNLGAPINTPYDEESPYIHPNGNTLYFSSKGHQSMGGFDVFYATRNEKSNAWNEPLNMGYPINTTDDDVFYVTSSDGKRGYYSSIRPEGYGGKDIYMASLPEKKEEPLITTNLEINKDSSMKDGSTGVPSNKFIFETYFKYNVTQTDVNGKPFKDYINHLEELYKSKGAISLSIISSASKVPTKAYLTNNELSIIRKDKIKEQLITALKARGISIDKISFKEIQTIVDGPEYQQDYLTNRAIYEKYQFVRVSAN